MGKIYNRARDGEKRRHLRRKSPPAEVLLWQRLRGHQLGGFKFKRQYGIAHYVADFCCATCRVVVELDGASHESDDAVDYDTNRQRYFESLGFTVVRFTNEQVCKEITGVLETLLAVCETRS